MPVLLKRRFLLRFHKRQSVRDRVKLLIKHFLQRLNPGNKTCQTAAGREEILNPPETDKETGAVENLDCSGRMFMNIERRLHKAPVGGAVPFDFHVHGQVPHGKLFVFNLHPHDNRVGMGQKHRAVLRQRQHPGSQALRCHVFLLIQIVNNDIRLSQEPRLFLRRAQGLQRKNARLLPKHLFKLQGNLSGITDHLNNGKSVIFPGNQRPDITVQELVIKLNKGGILVPSRGGNLIPLAAGLELADQQTGEMTGGIIHDR